MKDIIETLNEIIDLLNQTNWIEQADWYTQKRESIKKTNENSSEFRDLLKEIDKSVSGMGSFSDLPMEGKYSDIQWDLSIKMADTIKRYFNV